VLLTVALVAVDLLRQPLYDLTLRVLGVADMGLAVHVAAALSVLTAVAVATPLAFFLSRWLTGRLARLSQWSAEPVTGDDLPGPFDDSGNDEISAVAATMNSLRQRVADRLKSFALDDIRRREWVAQVSHDLRTPLTAQLACLDRADLILHKPDSAFRRNELRELLAVAKMDADRVQTLADDLLEIARLDAGDGLRLEPVPPGELVRQAVRGIEPLAAQKGMRIDVRITTHLPMLNADGRRLTRAIENLMRNAIQHGRSTIEVSAALSTTGCVRFEVRDDGRGLPKEPDFLDYLRRLNRDVRLTELARRRRRGDSAGLGLVVAQRVAEAHHGVVDAYNTVQGGAAFWMDIPVPAEDVAPTDDASVAG
jgi:signal transduction histidine kinase